MRSLPLRQTQAKRLTTVELIVDVQDWVQGVTIPPDKIVPIRIASGEVELRQKVKEAGLSDAAKRNAGM